MKKTLLLAALATGMAAGSAQAEFAVGGWLNLENDRFDGFTAKRVRGDILGSVSTQGGLTFGVGFSGEYFNTDFTSGYERIEGGNYAMVAFGDSASRFGRVVVTYGEIWGAGNIFPEDYFGFDDSTSNSDDTLRVDVDFGGHQFAVSYDFNGDGADYELGYAAEIGAYKLAIGYENDSEDLGILIGRQLSDKVAVQLAILEDLDDNGEADQIGLSGFFKPHERVNLGLNVAHADGGYHSAGLLATYTMEHAVLKAEFATYDEGFTGVEFGVLIPFGKTQPAHEARNAMKDYAGLGSF